MLHHTLLGLLARRPSSGYDIGKWLRTEGRWLGRGPSMTPVYRALSEIEDRGWVSTHVEKRDAAPPRRSTASPQASRLSEGCPSTGRRAPWPLTSRNG